MLLKLAWKNIWRNRRRTFITISAIGFAVLFAVAMRSFKQGMDESLLESVVEGSMGYLQIQNKAFWDDQSLDNGFYAEDIPVEAILNIKNVSAVDKKLEAGTLSSTGLNSRGTYIISYQDTEEIPSKIINNIIAGKFPSDEQNEILLGEELAEYLEADLGDTIIFLGPGYQGAMAAGLFRLSGLVDTHIPELNQMVAYMPMSELQNHLSAPGLVTALMVDLKDPGRLEQTRRKIEALIGEEYCVMSWEEMSPELKQTIDANDAEGVIMSYILYMIISFVMFGTTIMATQERKYEIGVLTAIGMKKWKSMLVILYEHVILSIIGVIFGVLAVAPIAYYFHTYPIQITGEAGELFESMGFNPVIPFSIDPQIAINHGSIVLLISIGLLFYPFIVVRKIKPAEAMKK